MPSLVRIDPSAVALPTDAPHDSPQTSEEKQASSSSSSSSNRNSSRDAGYKLEWREFTSLAAAAGLGSGATGQGCREVEGESNGNGNGDGAVEVSTSTSQPDAEGSQTRQPRRLDGDIVSGSGGDTLRGSAGADADDGVGTAEQS